MSVGETKGEAQSGGATSSRRVGIWLIGGRGAISTCLVYGLQGLREGLIEPIGLTTAMAPFDQLDLVEFGQIVVGGCEVRQGTLDSAARELVRERILDPSLVAATSAEAAAYDARLAPGLLDGPDVGMADLHPESARLGGASPREQIAEVVAQIEQFRSSEGLDRVVVVNLASTEAWRDQSTDWDSLSAFDAALDAGRAQPASMLYAYAAFKARCPYVNFTPNRGASSAALRELADATGMPHCGNDGKTGETLVKTALAPMFANRALKVLAWQGYNMLGNRDGEVLSDPLHKRAKVANKDEVLRDLIGHPDLHSHVSIDYVPSLSDWKTAWDLIHFEGFLGTRMTMQFTWAGCDSALATPLVLDLVRLTDLAAQRGESGVMQHTASFFKSPLGGGTHDFHAQFQRLLNYALAAKAAD